MKKIVTVILLISTCLLFGKIETLSSMAGYEYDLNTAIFVAKTSTEFVHDDDGRLLREAFSNHDESGWKAAWEKCYTYDENDYLVGIELYAYLEDMGSLEKSSKTEISRDENWNELESIDYSWDGEKYNEVTRTTYEYNENKVVKMERQNYENNKWRNSLLQEFTYNTEGLVMDVTVADWNGQSYDVGSRTSYTYNESSMMNCELVDINIGGNWEHFGKTEWIYTDDNQINTYDKYNFQNDDWVPDSHLENIFDDQGNKKESIYYNYKLADDPSAEPTLVPYWKDVYEYQDATGIENEKDIAANYFLSQNYPNPFNPSTTISYVLPQSSFVTLKVFDILGNEVTELVNKMKPAGKHEIIFNTDHLSSGTYFYVLQTDGFTETKKLLLVK